MLKPYITYIGHVMVEVRCKGDCPTVLVRREGPTPDYSELVIEIQVDGGRLGRMETAVCKACRARILSGGLREGELDAIFAQDMHQAVISATTAARPRIPRDRALAMAARFAHFIPLRALDERGRGDREATA